MTRDELKLRLMLLEEAGGYKWHLRRILSEAWRLKETEIGEALERANSIAQEQIDLILNIFDEFQSKAETALENAPDKATHSSPA